MSMNLQLRQSQSLVMTPQLQQAIKLLQYNHIEMAQHVQEAMLENPTLEAVPDSEGSSVSEREAEIREAAGQDKNDLNEQNNGEQSEVDWEKLLEHMSSQTRGPSMSGGTIHDDLPPIETNLTYGESLAEHLTWQLQLAKCNEVEEQAAVAIIGNLDERGYLTVPLDEIIEESDLRHPLEANHTLGELLHTLET